MAEVVGALFDEFVQGGLLDDADVTLVSARFVKWDYLGKSRGGDVLALKLSLRDSEGTVHDDHLSCGKLDFFVPSEDGKKAVPVGKATKLNINTNAIAFLISLINADTRGQLAAKIRSTDDISVIDGVNIHIKRVDQPKRANIVNPAIEVAGSDRTPQQLTVTKVNAYAGEAAPAGTAAPAAAAPVAAPVAAPAAAAPAGGASDAAADLLQQLTLAAGGSIAKSKVATAAFNDPDMKAKAAAERTAILSIIVTDAFLTGAAVAARGLVFDKAAGTIAMG